MYCGTCGNVLRDGARFCDHCGAAQPEPVIPESQKPKTEPEVSQPIAPAEIPAKPKEKVSKKLLAVVAAVLVVAILAAVLIPIFFPGKQTIYVLTGITYYDAEGNKTAHYVYEYDEFGNLLSTKYDQEGKEVSMEDPVLGTYTDYIYEFDGKFETYFEGEYDENGNIESWLHQYSYGFSVEYEYDKDGRIAEFVITMEHPMEYENTDGAEAMPVPVTYECEYDDESRLVRVFTHSDIYRDGFTTQLYEYDDDGYLTAVYWSSKEGTYRNDLSYEDGRLCMIEKYICQTPYFQSDSNPEYSFKGSVEYDYDKDGNLTETVFTDENGAEESSIEYEYTEEGFPEEETISYANGKEYTYEYTCDEHGNVIEVKNTDGTRSEYEYEERKVTAQQALYFHRQDDPRDLYGYTGNDWYVTSKFVPDPLTEQDD